VPFPDDGKSITGGFEIFLICSWWRQAVAVAKGGEVVAHRVIKVFARLKGKAGTPRRASHTTKRSGMDFIMKGDALGMFDKHCHGLS